MQLKQVSSLLHHRSERLIQSLALSPNEETLLVLTSDHHFYQISFSKMVGTTRFSFSFIGRQIDFYSKNSFVELTHCSHRGKILHGSISMRKGLLFTIGIDRFLRIWNLQTKFLLLSCPNERFECVFSDEEFHEEFPDDFLSFDVHPNGLFLSISFKSFLRIYLYTIELLHLYHQVDIAHAKKVIQPRRIVRRLCRTKESLDRIQSSGKPVGHGFGQCSARLFTPSLRTNLLHSIESETVPFDALVCR